MSFNMCMRWIAIVSMLGIVAGCGRAGSLEPPPGSAAAPVASEQGAEQVPPKEDRRFILDGLL